MTPIETRYKARVFRSRLEARWAVFFDALNIPWRYEEQGFELRSGAKYLPDFHLTTQDVWVEVKGVAPHFDDKCYEFVDEMTDVGVCAFVVIGMPPGERGSMNFYSTLRQHRGADAIFRAFVAAHEARFEQFK